jgi:hypothetical protein
MLGGMSSCGSSAYARPPRYGSTYGSRLEDSDDDYDDDEDFDGGSSSSFYGGRSSFSDIGAEDEGDYGSYMGMGYGSQFRGFPGGRGYGGVQGGYYSC